MIESTLVYPYDNKTPNNSLLVVIWCEWNIIWLNLRENLQKHFHEDQNTKKMMAYMQMNQRNLQYPLYFIEIKTLWVNWEMLRLFFYLSYREFISLLWFVPPDRYWFSFYITSCWSQPCWPTLISSWFIFSLCFASSLSTTSHLVGCRP
jgi:hypothetical protein